MAYSKRIEVLCSLLTQTKTFADVGCDHGYCSEYMLNNGLCERAILSDISKGSLAKAEELLQEYIRQGKAVAVLGDGFFGVPSDTEEVLIAGMGGSEIVSILSDEKYGFLPLRFVFQPMHDSEKLRRYLVKQGARIQADYTFEDGKFYDVIVGEAPKGTEDEKVTDYTEAAYEFGRDNLLNMPEAFVRRTEKLLKNLKKYAQEPNLQEESRAELAFRIQRLQGVLSGEIK